MSGSHTHSAGVLDAASEAGTPGAASDAVARVRETDRSIDALLAEMVDRGGSDLHLSVGRPPMVRLHGDIQPLGQRPDLTSGDIAGLIRSVLSSAQWDRFEAEHELDLAYALPGVARFRVNVFQQRGNPGAVLRTIPHEIKRMSDLGLPPAVERFATLPRGLVLVTGPTGSGKTTTLASLLDLANRTRSGHIVTIEDPIEFVHPHRKCVVNQREVGVDTADFATALRQVLRQDPDIILVGELRDIETMSVALTAAETGHLVLATLHTQSAAQTIDRVIDVFPASQQQEIRAQLSTALQGVVTQALVRRSDIVGRTVITEVMFVNSAIRNLIREGKNHQIPMMMQASSTEGMITFDQHLAQKVRDGIVDFADGFELCHDPEDYRRLTGRS